MGGLLVFRIKGKVVAQVHIYLRGGPTDPELKTLAKILCECDGEVEVHGFILSIIATLKESFDNVYMLPCNRPYDTCANWPFFHHCYVLDFTPGQLMIEARYLYGEWKHHDVKGFASLCELDLNMPIKDVLWLYNTPILESDDKEFVVMLNEQGFPYFVMAVRDWYSKVADFVLGIKMGAAKDKNLEDDRRSIDCLAAQVVKKTMQECGAEIGVGDIPYSDPSPRHFICCYQVQDVAMHEDYDAVVHGIHSITKQGTVVRKGMYYPHQPSINREYDEGDVKAINQKIKVTESPFEHIQAGDEGTLLFTRSDSHMCFFDTARYRGACFSDALDYTLVDPIVLKSKKRAREVDRAGSTLPSLNVEELISDETVKKAKEAWRLAFEWHQELFEKGDPMRSFYDIGPMASMLMNARD